ncbi:hypothetical protein D3C87_1257420 [compost metagenome]
MENLLDRPHLYQPAGIKHGNAVGCLGDDAHIMGDQHDSRLLFLAELAQQRDDLRLDRHVKRRRRFIGDDQFRRRRKCERYDDALAHAAGELMRMVIDALFRRWNTDITQKLDCACLCIPFRKRQMLADRLHKLRANRE